MKQDRSKYYEARGFSIYYFAERIFTIVSDRFSYLIGIEGILGEDAIVFFMQPFKRDTNLHEFIRSIVREIILEDLVEEEGMLFLSEFLETYHIPIPDDVIGDPDLMNEFLIETQEFYDGLDAVSEEIFHIMFNDVGFLHKFNKMCASYISHTDYGRHLTTKKGTLKRVRIPVWVKRSIFHRDRGECRECKRSLTGVINSKEIGCYDHIIPLAAFGPNDVTNIQLLCEPCNLEKSSKLLSVSNLYQKAV